LLKIRHIQYRRDAFCLHKPAPIQTGVK